MTSEHRWRDTLVVTIVFIGYPLFVIEDWDSYDRELAAHGLLPAEPVSLGYAMSALAWITWLAVAIPVIVIVVMLRC